jgi:predicted ester cyclase
MYSQIRNISIACIILIAFGGIFQTAAADTEANKALVRRVLEEAYNQGNLDVIDEVMAADYTWPMDNPKVRSSEEFKQHVAELRTNFPDIHAIVEDQIAEGDKVVTRWTIDLTPQVTMTGILISIIADGKIAGDWENSDELGLMEQLGVMPPTHEDYTWGTPSTIIGDLGDPVTNTALVLYVVQKFWNEQNIDTLDITHSPDAIAHNPVIPGSPLDFDGYKQTALMHLVAFPDLRVTTENIITEGDKVAIRWTVNGTHLGELMGIPPTEGPVTFTGITIYRFADGKIVENWWSYDALGMMQQITAPPESDPGQQ